MNIGILTYHWVSNFGANLQALSTYKYILNSGNTPFIINWIPEDVENYYLRNVQNSQNIAHRNFVKENFFNISSVCRDDKAIADEIERLNISKVIIGSDAVFTTVPSLAQFHLSKRGIIKSVPYSDSILPNPFWASFVTHLNHSVKMIAMSASAQNTPYHRILFSNEKKQYKKALERFDFMTVRDIWTKDMIRFVTNDELNPIITPDPVFAFEQNVHPERLSYVDKKLNINCPYVLYSAWASIKDNEWLLELERLFAEKSIALVGLPITTMKGIESPLKLNLAFPISPLEWYDSIKYSAGYIGGLMHPVLVSLHNSVPVFSFDTYGFRKWGKLNVKSSKTYQILSKFDLLENYYNKKYNRMLPSPSEVVNKILNFDKERCSCVSKQMLHEYNNMMNKIIAL